MEGLTRLPFARVAGWGLMGHPPAQYVVGTRPDDGCRTPEDLSSGAIADFLMRHPEVTTASAKVQRCLAWLSLEFGPE